MDPGRSLAIACPCGASAPILFSDAGGLHPPGSLMSYLSSGGRRDPGHLEYYLGYSDHESERKDQFIDLLVSYGGTWQRDCPEDRCQRAFERAIERWKRVLAERVSHGP